MLNVIKSTGLANPNCETATRVNIEMTNFINAVYYLHAYHAIHQLHLYSIVGSTVTDAFRHASNEYNNTATQIKPKTIPCVTPNCS